MFTAGEAHADPAIPPDSGTTARRTTLWVPNPQRGEPSWLFRQKNCNPSPASWPPATSDIGVESGAKKHLITRPLQALMDTRLTAPRKEKALEITVQYAKDRQQFDKPLGAFQALAHYMADAATNIDGAEVLVHEAAWARSEGRPVAKLAPMAKLYACQAYRDVTAMAQQIFGGIGFTVEFDIQLYFRRAKQLQMSWWEPRILEELIAVEVLDQ